MYQAQNQALCTYSSKQNKLQTTQSLPTEEWINALQFVHKMEYYTITKTEHNIHNMDASQNTMLSEKKKDLLYLLTILLTIFLHSQEVQTQARVIYGIINHKCIFREEEGLLIGMEHNEGFWGTDNGLFLELSGGYMGVFIWGSIY